ncbi:MAG: DNA internalization-related competence protein ComEC/Rec2 [Lachnospiraceae bacterium]|nr:DNA internalization-related competence protein ComEC/Rec2 [Lachnospiraceae bacterium]
MREIWICWLCRTEIDLERYRYYIIVLKMRRPLCLAGAVYVAAVIAGMVCLTRGAPVYEPLDKTHVAVAGFVDRKEERISQSGEVAVISLTDAIILKESQITVLEQFLSDSEKIPRYRLQSFWKQNRESLQKEEAAGIEGVLCYMEDENLPPMGSLVIMQGEYRAFTHATNPGEFDAADYYRIMGQQGRVMKCRCTVVSGMHDVFKENMYHLREYLSLLLEVCYDETDASVMRAMLLGEKGTLDAELKELYQHNGIIHILSISGLHLSVIGMGCHKILKKVRLPIAVNITLSIGLMYCYGTMTGMGISMLRAYIMFAMHLCAGLAGRTYDLLTAVTVAAVTVLIQQPLYLQHSGFLFSFGAICGIGIFLPAVEENLFGTAKTEKMLLSGAAVSVSTLPVYLSFYYEFPPYAVLLNLVVIPCMTVVLLCGLLGLGLAALFLPLGEAAAYPVHMFLVFYEKCCTICLSLPDSKWITGCPEPWQTVLFLGVLAALVVWNRRLPKLYFWQGVLCALLVLTIKLPQGLQITMVDVGQGDCIYLTEDGGVHMLIDGGSSDKSSVADYQIMPYLKHEGVSYLDAVVVTHPDSDHISGICTLLEETKTSGISIGMIYLPDVGDAGRNEGYHKLEDLAEDAGVTVRYISAGDVLRCGEIMLTCIHPEKGWNTTDINAYSTVLYLTYRDFTALFTGDLEGEGERKVMEAIEDMSLHNMTVLKVAHHGSKNSTEEAFLQMIDPEIALISSGRNNRYGHPHEELIGRLEKHGCLIYRTQESGAVTVRVRGRRVRIRGYLGG